VQWSFKLFNVKPHGDEAEIAATDPVVPAEGD
jgi:hypothetical protein